MSRLTASALLGFTLLTTTTAQGYLGTRASGIATSPFCHAYGCQAMPNGGPRTTVFTLNRMPEVLLSVERTQQNVDSAILTLNLVIRNPKNAAHYQTLMDDLQRTAAGVKVVNIPSGCFQPSSLLNVLYHRGNMQLKCAWYGTADQSVALLQITLEA